MFAKSWHVHVATEVALPESGSESLDLSSYYLASPTQKLRVVFSEVFRMQRSGAIRIDGAFP
jgi:hypothetical protein